MSEQPNDTERMGFILITDMRARQRSVAAYKDSDWETAVLAAIDRIIAERDTLKSLLNTPKTDDWFAGVRNEAGHQIQRWGSDHDAGKSPLDWFWLIGFLAQKAATSQMSDDTAKAMHHTISTGAALLNWHRVISGETGVMRPSIVPPHGEPHD